MAEAIAALEIRNLHKRYGDLEVLKGISLTANDGDVISILGSSGSGKSTFLRCINLLKTLTAGKSFFPAKNYSLNLIVKVSWLRRTISKLIACAPRLVLFFKTLTYGHT